MTGRKRGLPSRATFNRNLTSLKAALNRAVSRREIPQERAIEWGLKNVEWPGRLQRLLKGPLVEAAPTGAEIWLDGGHNPHGGAAVAQSMADLEERAPKPLYLISGMLKTKADA